jgi:hypothetical protein
MTDKIIGRIFLERDKYVKNRSARTAEEMARYGEQWVAWSADGAQLLAHDRDPNKVCDAVVAMGIGPEDFTMEWIPMGGEICLL